MDMMENYKRWLGKVTEEDLLTELKAIEGKEEEINDRFYRDLEFGTGGLRGVIGAGTFRMNEHTVARATQGYSNYLNKAAKNPSVSIAYDSRNKSDILQNRSKCICSQWDIGKYLQRIDAYTISFLCCACIEL